VWFAMVRLFTVLICSYGFVVFIGGGMGSVPVGRFCSCFWGFGWSIVGGVVYLTVSVSSVFCWCLVIL